jgi:hypothetical protein
MRALGREYNFKIFTRHELEDDFFDDVDLICIPGGVGDSDSYDYLMKINGQRIRNFVADGGHYLGICMGAYWADTDYLGLLNNVRVKQYIKHPTACTRRPHAKQMPVVWNGNQLGMYFYDGCTFEGYDFDIKSAWGMLYGTESYESTYGYNENTFIVHLRDVILDKILEKGIDSLTEFDKSFLV